MRISLLIISFFLLSAGSTENEIQVCMTGCHHSNEVDMDLSVPWYGLMRTGTSDTFQIKAVTPLITPCYDPIFEDDKGALTGKEVLVEEIDVHPSLLIGGIMLKEGKVETCYLRNPRCIFPGDALLFRFRKTEYAIVATGEVVFDTIQKAQIPYVKNYRLYLIGDVHGRSLMEEIYKVDILYPGEEAQPACWFAGDIDSDEKPDLIFNMSNHYNVGNTTLFLSSKAAPGKMLKMVASWSTTGC